jgi:peptidoglycan hydrolase CwlO-like protein
MKKIVVLILFSLIFSRSFPESIDSLKANREILYQKYLNINVPGKESNKADFEKSASILKDIVIVDTKIIKEFATFDKKVKAFDSKAKSLNDENDSLSKELSAANNYIRIINIAGGVIIVLLILSLIFLFIYIVKYSKLKKG